MGSLTNGIKCPECGALMIKVWDKATRQLKHYRCLGCGKKREKESKQQ